MTGNSSESGGNRKNRGDFRDLFKFPGYETSDGGYMIYDVQNAEAYVKARDAELAVDIVENR